jgi:hypothetical protein
LNWHYDLTLTLRITRNMPREQIHIGNQPTFLLTIYINKYLIGDANNTKRVNIYLLGLFRRSSSPTNPSSKCNSLASYFALERAKNQLFRCRRINYIEACPINLSRR